MKFILSKLFLISFLILLSDTAFSYPELSIHGYANCTACHLSPSGGGLLTAYGRELSKELLSTWSKENEHQFAYGKIDLNEKLLLGAFVRGIQTYSNDSNQTTARTILMQADAEAAYDFGSFAIDASVGRQELRTGLQSNGRLWSRRHYLLARINESQNIRFGKFLRSFGLNDPNHNLYVRKYLNFGFDTETYQIEYSYLGEAISIYASYIMGSFNDDRAYNKEKGALLSASYFFDEKQKIGISFYSAEDDNFKKNVVGPWFVLSLNKIFLLSEIDFQNKISKAFTGSTNGYVMSHRLGYVAKQGIIPFMSYDRKNLDSNSNADERSAYGLGLQLFPRPHFELVATLQREMVTVTNSQSDLYWLLAHFYL